MLLDSILDGVGRTPIVRLSRLCAGLKSTVFLKLENLNPGGSHKVRIALHMIREAERKGELRPGDTILEATGGNTGRGIAMAAVVLGYKVVLVVPDNYSDRKVKILTEMGVQVVRSDSRRGLNSHGELAQQLQFDHPEYYQLFQAENHANPEIHRRTTAPEILSDLASFSLHFFVAGFGTRGHLTGIGEVLKAAHPKLKVVAVQPEGCDIAAGTFAPHAIQGLAVGRLPGNLNKGIIDSVRSVSYADAVAMLRRLLRVEGISAGLSSGAVLSAAMNIAQESHASANIVCLAYDSADDYLEGLPID